MSRRADFQAIIDAPSQVLRIVFRSPVAAHGVAAKGLVRKIGVVGSRWSLTLARPAVVATVRWVPAPADGGARAEIDLAPGDAIAMRSVSGVVYRPDDSAAPIAPTSIGALLARPASPLAAQQPARRPSAMPNAPERRKVIVIDAGHGGIDPGAESVLGYHEKEVTLVTARALRRVLEQTGRYSVVMTRDSDIYLKLQDRVARARAAHGDLFISLHADSVAGGEGDARGASIYTLSQTASDAESERLAQRENRADALGGVEVGAANADVADILVDLTVRESVGNGGRFANLLIDALPRDGVALFPRQPHRSAGFAVLKAPDIPSVLVEMGYLSDGADSRGLADPRHQLAIARGVADGVDRYFALTQAPR